VVRKYLKIAEGFNSYIHIQSLTYFPVGQSTLFVIA